MASLQIRQHVHSVSRVNAVSRLAQDVMTLDNCLHRKDGWKASRKMTIQIGEDGKSPFVDKHASNLVHRISRKNQDILDLTM